MVSKILSLSGFNRAIALATGAAGGYAFTNPDADNVYDIFPLQKPPPFAFINVYKVNKEDAWKFEDAWRDLARFKQSQEGYLYTKLHKIDADDTTLKDETPKYQYIDMTQWTTGDAHRRALLRTGYKDLIDALPGDNKQDPLMYAVVVDDLQPQTQA
mmetsp:Transcript_108431/g.188198  ORF Transcript_108431/g.188198 Transcript_108431/m.188198 type:complete len:157 (-) Transcript_108431:77-547(-)